MEKPESIKPNVLDQEKRREAEDIANSQADVTRDGGQRSPEWKPYLVDPEDENAERPYSRRKL